MTIYGTWRAVKGTCQHVPEDVNMIHAICQQVPWHVAADCGGLSSQWGRPTLGTRYWPGSTGQLWAT